MTTPEPHPDDTTGSSTASSAAGPRSYVAALLGQGVGPSLTPELHEREATRQGLRYAYKIVELGPDDVRPDSLRVLLRSAVQLGCDGLNVTHPVKHAMRMLVDDVSPEAAAIGAINTVVVRAGTTTGHNTDVSGFSAALREGLPGCSLDYVVLLGAGGAGNAVAHALATSGVGALCVVDPDRARADGLAESLEALGDGPQVHTSTPASVAPHVRKASGLVNATPVGMAAHPGAPLDVDLLDADTWVADVVYRPLWTELLRAARERGCQTLTGARMAVHQAADAFELFTGLAADRAAMFGDFDDLVAAEMHEMPQERSGPAPDRQGTRE